MHLLRTTIYLQVWSDDSSRKGIQKLEAYKSDKYNILI
nr:MAG TPA: hypothetical protein [Caudoviricetes sp.]